VNHDVLLPVALGIVIGAGAFLFFRMGLKELLQGVRDVLQEVGEFIKWYRAWKNNIWPPASK
jgi:hypothetical protein